MASRRIAGITIEIDGNTTKLNSALKDTDKQLNSTQAQLKDVNKLLKLDPRNTELLSQKQKLLTEAVKGSKDRLKELERAAEQLAQKDSTPEVQAQQDALQREIAETKGKLKEFENELKKVPNKAKQAFDKVSEKLQDVGEKISTAGAEMTKMVTGPIVAVGAGAVAAFTEVDDAMDRLVIKTGASGDALKEMEGIVESMATTIPTDFNTAAEAVGEVNTRFGLMGDELEDLSTAFVQFSELNQTDVSSSIDIVSSMMAAFGLEAKDASKVLDRLNATSQRTGIKVDRLADVVQNNASALQEMGMTAADAIDFLGDVEVSGADVGVVMAGLRTAYKKAVKEGRPLNEVLKDFSASMKSNKSDTEKTQEAIELFGAKAGAAIKNAADQGRLSFDNLGETLESTAGNVQKTFEGTVDPIDNFKMAMNELKLVGADVGAMLSEFAGPILQKVRDGLSKALEKWRGLTEGQQETIIKAAGVVAAIGPVVTVIGKVTQVVGKLSSALGILAAHPVAAMFIGVAGAIGGAVIAFQNATAAGEDYMQQTFGINDAMQANIDKINELSGTYSEIDTTREDLFTSLDTEYTHLQDLADEYDTLIDSNGQVKQGYEDRAEFILTTLSESLGVERDELDQIIAKNGELSSSIQDVIEKRKAESFLTAYEEEYRKALDGAKESKDALAQAEADYYAKSKQVADIEKKKAELTAKANQEIAEMGRVTYETNDALQDLRVDEEYARDAVAKSEDSVRKAKTTYEGYNATIQNYEGVSSAVITGDATKISDSLEMMRTDFRTTQNSTVETLEEQYRQYQEQYDNAKTAVENGSTAITEADLAEKQRWLLKAKNEYDKAVRQANSAGRSMGSQYSKGMLDKKAAVQIAAEKVASAGLGKLDVDTYTTGQNFATGFSDGMWAKIDDVKNRARQIANEAKRQMEYTLEIMSPSRVMARVGKYFTEGFAEGITDADKSAMTAAENLAKDTVHVVQVENSNRMAAKNPYMERMDLVSSLKTALSQMYVVLDDDVAGKFVTNKVTEAVYGL